MSRSKTQIPDDLAIENPKSQAPNPKQISKSKIPSPKKDKTVDGRQT
jgi:hypothetical protein